MIQQIEPSFPTSSAQRTPCMLVLDISGSMLNKVKGTAHTRIHELNQGLKLLQKDLIEDEAASTRVQLAIVAVGGPDGDARLITDWTDALEFEPPVLQAKGPTPLGQGMRLALQHVEEQKHRLQQHGIPYHRPWIMVISDGDPTDGPQLWDTVARECRAAEQNKRCVIFPIGVAGANLEYLKQLSATPPARLTETKFKEYFQWLSSSLQSISKSAPGSKVVLPASSPWASFN